MTTPNEAFAPFVQMFEELVKVLITGAVELDMVIRLAKLASITEAWWLLFFHSLRLWYFHGYFRRATMKLLHVAFGDGRKRTDPEPRR